MQITCGTDMIEIERIKDSISRQGDKFLNKIYTKTEIEYCNSKKAAKYQHFAARFAAKEAAFKAIASFCENKYDISWKNAEITNDLNGKPIITLIDIKLPNIKIDLSISHCKEYAIAMCVAVNEKE